MSTEPNLPPDLDEGDVYSPLMDDGFDVREVENRRAMLLLGGAFAFLLLIAVVLLKAYGPGTRGADEPPRILADTSPYKSAPENPGGTQTPNQDKTVYDVISGDSRTENVVVAPGSEKPIKVQPTPNAATVIVKRPETGMAAPIAPVPAAPRATVQTRPTSAQNAQQQTAAGNSDYVVQVASLRSQDEASRSWANLNTKVGDIIPSYLFADIKRADLGDKGIYYRLRVSGFNSKDNATTFCTRLKARAQDCIVVIR